MYIRHIYFHHTRGKSSIHHHSPHCKPQKRTQKNFLHHFPLTVCGCCYHGIVLLLFFSVRCAEYFCRVLCDDFFYYYLGARFFKRAFINPYISFGSAFLELILALISNLRISLSLDPTNL